MYQRAEGLRAALTEKAEVSALCWEPQHRHPTSAGIKLLQQDEAVHELSPNYDIIVSICQNLCLFTRECWQEQMKNWPINEILCTHLLEKYWIFCHLHSREAAPLRSQIQPREQQLPRDKPVDGCKAPLGLKIFFINLFLIKLSLYVRSTSCHRFKCNCSIID